MNSRMLRILAVFLALGSVIVGYVGYKLSQQQNMQLSPESAVQSPVLPENTHPVVIAVHALSPGHAINSDDLGIVPFPVRPEGAYEKPANLVGKIPTLAIAAGEAPLPRHFLPGSSLARAVRSGERAIAVKVDEVIGSGGLVQPGDYVDVLLYLRGGSKELPKSSAQVVLRHARVLAYGEAVIDTHEGTGTNDARNANGRSAVLAVPVEQTSALMLAATAGTLRLAVYGVEEGLSLAEGVPPATPAPRSVTLGELAKQSQTTVRRATGQRVTVFRGANKETVEAR